MFEAAGDDLALYIAYAALGQVGEHARADGRGAGGVRARRRPRAAGRQCRTSFVGLAAPRCRFYGTTPVSELLAWLDEQEPRAGVRTSSSRVDRAVALAMLGRFDEARAIIAETRAELAERGGGVAARERLGPSPSRSSSWPAIPPPPPSSEQKGAGCYDELGEQSFLSTAAGSLAQALYELDRLDEADAWAGRAAELGASDDAVTQMLWRQVRAKVLARRGRARGGRAARPRGGRDRRRRPTCSTRRADAYADLGEVLLLAGKPDEAAAALEQALERYERKGNLVSAAARARRLAGAAPRCPPREHLGVRRPVPRPAA